MWQEVLALDSRVCDARMKNMTKQERERLKPLYLKRRMQLLGSGGGGLASDSGGYSSGGACPDQEDPCLQDEPHPRIRGNGPVLRSRRYLSLRIKLLKGQFGLPPDLLSLRSLTLSSPSPGSAAPEPAAPATATRCDGPGGTVELNRVHHILDGLHKSEVIRMVLVGASGPSPALLGLSAEGLLSWTSIHTLESKSLSGTPSLHPGVSDFDVSEDGDLLVSAHSDGSLGLVQLSTGVQLRRTQPPQAQQHQALQHLQQHHQQQQPNLPVSLNVTKVRFVPRNNNLVVCATKEGLLTLFNVSTGMFVQEGFVHATSRTTCLETDRVCLLWAGSERGHLESFRLGEQRIMKGCRITVAGGGSNLSSGNTSAELLHHQPSSSASQLKPYCPVTSLSARRESSLLLATVEGSANLFMFRVVDDFGTVSLTRVFADAPNFVAVRCASFASGEQPVSGQTRAVCGAEDGSILFFDVDKEMRSCVDKLVGHSCPVTSVIYQVDQKVMASADSSGQIILWKKA